MPRSHKHLITALALFAVLGAQVFGLQRGFVCICNGEWVETSAASCLPEEDCCSHDHEAAPHDHAPLKVKHEAQPKLSSNLSVQAPQLLAILNFSDLPGALWSTLHPVKLLGSRPPPDKLDCPPAPLLVAECTVLLI